MLQTIVIHELDRQLAEARAITMAMMRGFRFVKVVEREQVSGAWRFVVDLHIPRSRRTEEREP